MTQPIAVRWNTRGVRNGAHTIALRVTEADGRVTRSRAQAVTVKNPDIDIRATDEDAWQVTRRKTDTGRTNKLEVDKTALVRINGVWR